jgi:hypothetical protein
MCAIMHKPVEHFIVDEIGGIPVRFEGPAGSCEVVLDTEAVRGIARALNSSRAIIFEGENDQSLSELQALLGVSSGHTPLPAISSRDFSTEITPSSAAFVFFPVRYSKDDARLCGSSLIGGRALALDDHFDTTFLTASTEVMRHTLAECGVAAEAYTAPEEIDRVKLSNSMHKAFVAMRGRLETLANSNAAGAEHLCEAARSSEEFLHTVDILTAMALVTENIKVAAESPASKIASAVSAEEVGILAAEAGLQAAIGHVNAADGFLRSLDHLVSFALTGPAREFALMKSIGLGLAKEICSLFETISVEHGFEK